jgi:hypothetical protein
MKKSVVVIVLLIVGFHTFSQNKKDTLTNNKIIIMVKNGISDMLIKKAVLNAQYYNFDLTSDGLITLKQNKVSDSIIVTLFDKNKDFSNSAANTIQNIPISQSSSTSSQEIKDLKLKPGLYYFDPTENKYIKLPGIRSSMQFRALMTGGMRWYYEFNGAKALRSIGTFSPEFYLVEGSNQSGTVFEPSRFVLINVEIQKKNRRIDLSNGTFGIKSAMGPSFFSERDGMVNPKYTEISEGLYKITFEKKLPNGQYFFAPSQIIKDVSMEFFEFGIQSK